MREFITKSILLDGDSLERKRCEILEHFKKIYTLYERLFDNFVNDKVFYEQPERLRHPLIFYFGHTATFYINKLVLAKLLHNRINAKFESMFAIGVDEMSWDDLNESHYNWPSVDDVREYRSKAKELIIDLIQTIDFTLPIDWESPMWAILMGIEHEKIHLETSSVLIRQLPINLVKKSDIFKICEDKSDSYPTNELIDVSGSTIRLGKSFHSNLYGWDNEYGKFKDDVKDFKASRYLVSNGEFMEFVLDNGYEKLEYWSEEGSKWLTFKNVKYPTFWVKDGDKFRYRAMLELIDMPYNWPVDVNYHEAKAFCNYKSKKLGIKLRLPSESEYYRLREICEIADEPYWSKAPANINLEHFASSTPVDMFKMGEFYDVVGNVWQWSETPISGFDGFKVHPLYDDFSTPTFDNRHNLIKGGSWISCGNEATKESRYAFRRHFYQHAGFRYIQSDIDIKLTDINYESDTQVTQYCEFHYGDNYFGVENFAKKSSEIVFEVMRNRDKFKALDLGCSVGRLSFELAREFESVTGIDFSARFIKIAYELQKEGEIRYLIKDEGDLTIYRVKKLKEFGLEEYRDRIEFFQGDACNLKPMFTNYDLIFMGNLIDRIYNPKRLLTTIHERLNIGGILIITSPYTWLEDYTDKNDWLGGFKDKNGESIKSRFTIESILKENFKRIKEPFDIDFVIRETTKKYQHSLSEFNIFERIK